MLNNTKLAPPKEIYVRCLEALFQEDPDVEIVFEADKETVTVYVKGADKANALKEIINDEVTIGNEKLTIDVIHDDSEDTTLIDKYRDAFAGNGAISKIVENTTPLLQGSFHVVFKPEVVQFQADDISDIHGLRSTLYETLAREVLKTPGNVFFNTDELPWFRK